MIGYQRKGTSEAGAPEYIGRWRKPPVWLSFFCLSVALYCCLHLRGWIHSVYASPPEYYSYNPSEPFYRLVACCIFIPSISILTAYSGLWMLVTRYKMRHLDTISGICKQVGISKYSFETWRMKQEVVPSININGIDYYNPADFKDAGTLLRASAQPAAVPDTLLRPAGNAEQEAPEQLLRANAGGCTLNPGLLPDSLLRRREKGANAFIDVDVSTWLELTKTFISFAPFSL